MIILQRILGLYFDYFLITFCDMHVLHPLAYTFKRNIGLRIVSFILSIHL